MELGMGLIVERLGMRLEIWLRLGLRELPAKAGHGTVHMACHRARNRAGHGLWIVAES